MQCSNLVCVCVLNVPFYAMFLRALCWHCCSTYVDVCVCRTCFCTYSPQNRQNAVRALQLFLLNLFFCVCILLWFIWNELSSQWHKFVLFVQRDFFLTVHLLFLLWDFEWLCCGLVSMFYALNIEFCFPTKFMLAGIFFLLLFLFFSVQIQTRSIYLLHLYRASKRRAQ